MTYDYGAVVDCVYSIVNQSEIVCKVYVRREMVDGGERGMRWGKHGERRKAGQKGECVVGVLAVDCRL